LGYIGKTKHSISERFKVHIRDSRRFVNKERPLYRAFKAYGIENFKIEKIFECLDDKVLCEREIYYIKHYDTYKNGYNATYGGDGACYLNFNSKEVFEKNKELKSLQKTADYFNVSRNTIRDLLKSNSFFIFKDKDCHKKKIKIHELNLFFYSLSDLTDYVIKENISISKNKKNVKNAISCCALYNKKYRNLTITYL
jgi:hypothetical protein